jgi:hypothetical protein
MSGEQGRCGPAAQEWGITMPRRIDDNQNETQKTDVIRRSRKVSGRRRLKLIEQEAIPPAPTGYHPRAAKDALKGLEIQYEPPYESASMPIGQRSEHPEYDTGRPLVRPVPPEEEEEAAA